MQLLIQFYSLKKYAFQGPMSNMLGSSMSTYHFLSPSYVWYIIMPRYLYLSETLARESFLTLRPEYSDRDFTDDMHFLGWKQQCFYSNLTDVYYYGSKVSLGFKYISSYENNNVLFKFHWCFCQRKIEIKSVLICAMANQRWPISSTSYVVTRPQCVEFIWALWRIYALAN